MTAALLFVLTVFLAYSNGANDNFKGVATLYGSKLLKYRSALVLATVATLLGSLFSIVLAPSLVQHFSGKGLVPDSVASAAPFHIAVVGAVGVTVILATRFGFPISTTHALTGSLVGVGFVAVGRDVNLKQLGVVFVLPLLTSPLIAIFLGLSIFYLFKMFRLNTPTTYCLCRSDAKSFIVGGVMESAVAIGTLPSVILGESSTCKGNDLTEIATVKERSVLNTIHYMSAGTVCFARSLNDTPKIVALMFISNRFSFAWGAVAVAGGMALGGMLNARKVAETMSKKIVKMEESEGLAANLVTSVLVLLSSRFGLPVSTTHISVGSMVGVGLVTRKVNSGMFGQIVLSWVLTLPIAALLGMVLYFMLNKVL